MRALFLLSLLLAQLLASAAQVVPYCQASHGRSGGAERAAQVAALHSSCGFTSSCGGSNPISTSSP